MPHDMPLLLRGIMLLFGLNAGYDSMVLHVSCSVRPVQSLPLLTSSIYQMSLSDVCLGERGGG